MKNTKNNILFGSNPCLQDLYPGTFFKFVNDNVHVPPNTLFYKITLDCSFIAIHKEAGINKRCEHRVPDLETAKVIQYDTEIKLTENND